MHLLCFSSWGTQMEVQLLRRAQYLWYISEEAFEFYLHFLLSTQVGWTPSLKSTSCAVFFSKQLVIRDATLPFHTTSESVTRSTEQTERNKYWWKAFFLCLTREKNLLSLASQKLIQPTNHRAFFCWERWRVVLLFQCDNKRQHQKKKFLSSSTVQLLD